VLDERVIAASADDDMVEERDAQDLGSIMKAACNLAIFRGRI
jgi:hypothetical protein